MKNATTPEAGAKILDDMGVDKAFISEAFNKYSSYATKIPGLNASKAKSMLNAITGAMRGGSTPSKASEQTSKPIFDKNKYPKV